MLQIGNTSVCLSGETIVCEASTGDVHGSIRTKHKLKSVIPKSVSYTHLTLPTIYSV